ncbi:unnamed protein product [Amoebophrya sp. A25]|nr:unnamed protein product [Amoebophrya sp. A25]|eukprot:GSA25T00017813001.1
MERAVRDDIEVIGANYPVPPSKMFIAQTLQTIQIVLFALIFIGETIFASVKLPTPAVVQVLSGNKAASFMLIWLFGNVVASAFLQTGAFEIYYQNKLAWSALAQKQHRLPTYYDIMNGCKQVGLELMQSQARP